MNVNIQVNRAEKGMSWITTLFFAAIIGAAIYAGYHILPFYYYYYELKNHFEQVIKVAEVDTDEDIRRKLMYHIKKFEIPCDPEDLRIERSDDMMTISLKYQEIFSVPWQGKDYDLHIFDFDATVSGKYK